MGLGEKGGRGYWEEKKEGKLCNMREREKGEMREGRGNWRLERGEREKRRNFK